MQSRECIESLNYNIKYIWIGYTGFENDRYKRGSKETREVAIENVHGKREYTV
jgi:uncharacterized membrane protein